MSEVSQPNEQLIEIVEQALIEIDEVDSLEVYPEKQVISWLRALLDERRNNLREMDARDREYDWTCKLLQQTREENKRLETKYHVDMNNYRSQVQTWQQQHDSQIISLRKELSAKDKVLEWYENKETYELKINDESDPPGQAYTDVIEDCGKKARSILSQYRGDTHD